MTGWSSKPEWPSVEQDKNTDIPWPDPNQFTIDALKELEQANKNVISATEVVLIDSIPDVAKVLIATIPKVYNNKVPTHDPYSNPNAQLYYQCDCGAILDPRTKSFAALNNAASNEGWKVRWRPNGTGYQPFCVECGKGVE